jgi:hypothetical protein
MHRRCRKKSTDSCERQHLPEACTLRTTASGLRRAPEVRGVSWQNAPGAHQGCSLATPDGTGTAVEYASACLRADWYPQARNALPRHGARLQASRYTARQWTPSAGSGDSAHPIPACQILSCPAANLQPFMTQQPARDNCSSWSAESCRRMECSADENASTHAHSLLVDTPGRRNSTGASPPSRVMALQLPTSGDPCGVTVGRQSMWWTLPQVLTGSP